MFDQCFVVTDIKIIHGPKGLFVSMPSKKRKDGTFKDIAHPLNNQMRQYLEEKVLTVYRQQVASAPGAAAAERRGGARAGGVGGAPAGRGRPGSGSGPRATAEAAGRRHLSRSRLGRGQAVRRGALDPVFEGSNPSAPATRSGRMGSVRRDANSEREGMGRELRVFSGTAHPALGEAIARCLGVPLGHAHLSRFSDGEVWFQIQDNVRGADVFVVQPTGPPVNENLMELLVMLDAFKRSSASRVTAVIPYYGYARQDRKDRPRVPISAKLVADLLSTAGTDRVLTMDLHSAQIQGFFNTPVDHLFAAPVIIDYVLR